jgi:hypothetical protein
VPILQFNYTAPQLAIMPKGTFSPPYNNRHFTWLPPCVELVEMNDRITTCVL